AGWALSECLYLVQRVRGPLRRNLVLQGLGDIARSQGDAAAAHRFCSDALGACRDIGRPAAIADAHLKLAFTAVAGGDAREATRLLEESLDGYRKDRDTGGVLWMIEGLALVAAQRGERELAAVLLGASE